MTNEIEMPPGWEIKVDASTRKRYYLCHSTKTTQWEDPRLTHPRIWSGTVNRWRQQMLDAVRFQFPDCSENEIRSVLIDTVFNLDETIAKLIDRGYELRPFSAQHGYLPTSIDVQPVAQKNRSPNLSASKSKPKQHHWTEQLKQDNSISSAVVADQSRIAAEQKRQVEEQLLRQHQHEAQIREQQSQVTVFESHQSIAENNNDDDDHYDFEPNLRSPSISSTESINMVNENLFDINDTNRHHRSCSHGVNPELHQRMNRILRTGSVLANGAQSANRCGAIAANRCGKMSIIG